MSEERREEEGVQRGVIQTGGRQEMSGRLVPGTTLHFDGTRKKKAQWCRLGNSQVIESVASFFL